MENYKQKFDKGDSRKRKISKNYREYLRNKDLSKYVSTFDPLDESYKRF
jgi:hypothetical protein